MKVLYVSKALVVGAYREKLDALADHVDVRGVVPEHWGNGRIEPLEPGSRIAAWPARFHGRNHLHLYRRPARLLAEERPDLLHVDEEPYSAVTCQLVRLARRRGVPAVFFAWQNIVKRLPVPFGAIRRYVFRAASGALAGTDAAARVLEAHGYSGPLAVIPQFGVNPRLFRPDPEARRRTRAALGFGEDDLVVGYGGRLVPEKGLGLLVEAAAGVPGLRLLLVGDGPEREALERGARAAGVRDRLHFTGHRPSTEMPWWLAACDIVVLPSVGRRGWNEQFGRILVEAMACGVAVVGTTNGEIPQVLGPAGVVVPAGDGEALLRVLRSLAESEERREDLGRRGRARVEELYTHERIASRTAEFYREVVR